MCKVHILKWIWTARQHVVSWLITHPSSAAYMSHIHLPSDTPQAVVAVMICYCSLQEVPQKKQEKLPFFTLVSLNCWQWLSLEFIPSHGCWKKQGWSNNYYSAFSYKSRKQLEASTLYYIFHKELTLSPEKRISTYLPQTLHLFLRQWGDHTEIQ